MYVLLVAAFIAAVILLPGLFSIVLLKPGAFAFMLCFLPLDYLLFRSIFKAVQKKTDAIKNKQPA